MRSTLFFIPYELGPFTVFGFGWVALLVLAAWLLLIGYRRSLGQSWSDSARDWVTWSIAIAAVVFVVPRMETYFPDNVGGYYPIGLPIRGYGLFLMSGVVGAFAVTAYRGPKVGISGDALMSLSVVTVFGGVLGARLFYVIQKWSELEGQTISEKLISAVKFTEGGLVVFGSFIGGAVAVIGWCLMKRYRLLVMGDLLAPGLMIGLALGRLGCLMNGCCYGGVCETNLPSLSFPSGSLPYMEQLDSGLLLGLKFEGDPNRPSGASIISVKPGSWAASHSISANQRVTSLLSRTVPPDRDQDPAGPMRVEGEITVDGRMYRFDGSLPQTSLPTHPTQLYSSINAWLIFGFLFLWWPNIRRDGLVLAAWLMMCGASRMLEEWIRIDEKGQFGTSLTISQWISLGGILGGIAICCYVLRLPVGRHRLPRGDDAKTAGSQNVF